MTATEVQVAGLASLRAIQTALPLLLEGIDVKLRLVVERGGLSDAGAAPLTSYVILFGPSGCQLVAMVNAAFPTFGPEAFVPSPTIARVGTNGGEYVLHKDTVDKLTAGGGNNVELLREIRGLRADFRRLPASFARSTRDAALIGNA